MDRDTLEREILNWRRRRAARATGLDLQPTQRSARRMVMDGREVLVVRRGRPQSTAG